MRVRVLLVLLCLGAGPADKLPTPQPERCLGFIPSLDDESTSAPMGLDYHQVSDALNGVIQTALYCPRPSGFDEVHLTFELKVACTGIVDTVQVSDAGGAPSEYAQCIADVIKKADFPAHDMADGMPVTYPVDVAW